MPSYRFTTIPSTIQNYWYRFTGLGVIEYKQKQKIYSKFITLLREQQLVIIMSKNKYDTHKYNIFYFCQRIAYGAKWNKTTEIKMQTLRTKPWWVASATRVATRSPSQKVCAADTEQCLHYLVHFSRNWMRACFLSCRLLLYSLTDNQ